MAVPLFYAIELDVYVPAVSGATIGPGRMTRARMTPADPTALESYDTIRASDAGYRTKPTDTPAVQVYPPLLLEAFSIDRRLALDPAGATNAVAWGSLSFSNSGGAYDSAVSVKNCDGRAVRIYAGTRAYDAGRGYWTDPSFASLAALFQGIAQPWQLNDQTLDVPIRDATYWIEKPLQSSLYTGAGGYTGGADLLGLPKPKTRGTVANITPVLMDPTNRIYQYSDGPGTVTALYEGGDTNITFQSDTTNLYAGSTTAGQYRTDNSRGLFQLGSSPVRTITIDATGAFPTAGSQTTVANIARYLLSEDMSLPAGNLATATFTAANTAYPYAAGVYFGAAPISGTDAIASVLIGAGLKLIPLRSGALAVFALRDVSAATPIATIDATTAVSCLPVALPSNVNPPPYRFRVGYNRNYTPGASDTSPAVTSMTRRSFLSSAYRYAAWSSSAVLLAYRRPSDPQPISSALVNLSDAQAVANALGALWGVRRRLYAVVLPASIALAREIGDVVTLKWPVDDLRNGKVGQIVGEQIRSGDAASTLYVLV